MATKLRQVDREALRRAVERQRQRGGESARQIEAELASEPWQDAAEFAAYSQQVANLHLKPWQIPPCWLCTANDLKVALAMPHDFSGRRRAGELVRRLLAAGLSRFEPDPMTALAVAEARAGAGASQAFGCPQDAPRSTGTAARAFSPRGRDRCHFRKKLY